MSYHPKRPKSLITKHAIFPPNINPSSKTPELHTRLFIPGSLLNKKFENKEIRPLTAKIVNISRITHMKEPPPKKEDFFLLPRYMEVQPRNYPKLKKRPHSFNSKASEPVDQSKIIANSIKISNNRYNDQESSTKERKHSFCIKKAKPHKPTLTKEAENSLNKTLGKNPELPYLPETSSINPYDTFQKLLNKSKQVSHAKNSSSLIKETKIFDFSISINQDKSLIPSKLKLKEEFQKNQEEDNEFLSIKEKTSFLDKTKEPELSLLDDSEKAFVKIRSIEEFLEMIKNKEVHPLEFIYLFKPKQAEAYDLKVVSYLTITRLKAKQYFTLSSKGITFFEKGLPKEFIFLGDWLRERDQYLALKSLSFFRKFRKWKSLKKWQKLLQIRRNKHVAKVLSENLFQIHSIYQKILLKHRSFTANIEAMRLMDFSSFLEVKSLEDFATIQEKKRRLIFEYLQILSEQMHENCSLGLQTLMDRIRSHVRNELSEEDEQSGLINKSINAINFQGKKIAKPENKRGLIEILNLPENLNYQHRSLVRSECLKILRFTYLLDFLTLESLSNVYISSLKDFLQKVVKMKGSDLKTRDFMKKRSQELDPLLLIKAKFIPAFLEKKELVIEEVEIDGFDIASHIEDFDLELYAEFKDPPFISDNEEDNLPKNKTIMYYFTFYIRGYFIYYFWGVET